MSSYLGHEQQEELNGIGANQAMRTHGMVYDAKKTRRAFAAILLVLLVVVGIIYAASRVQTRETLYVSYNGVLYKYSGMEADPGYADELGIVDIGTAVSVGKSYQDLSLNFETNDKDLSGSTVYIVPGSDEQLFIEDENGDYTILVPAD